MKVYIGGNNGVGKTTLIKYFCSIHPYFQAFSSSDVIMTTHNIHSREEMKELVINSKLIEQFYSPYKKLLVDGHFFLQDYEKQTFDIFIFMTAEPNKILKRRLEDAERKREITIESVLDEEQKTIHRIVKSKINPVFVLYNNGSIEQTLLDLNKIIELYKAITESRILTVAEISKLAHKNGICLIQDILIKEANKELETAFIQKSEMEVK